MALPKITQEINTIKSTYFPLTSKKIVFTNDTAATEIFKNVPTSAIGIRGGTSTKDGGWLALRGDQNSNNPGSFELKAISSVDGTSASLLGLPDGTLTWGGNAVITSAGGSMSGGLVSSSNVAYQTNNSSHCDYGYNYADRTGALLAMRSSGYTNNPGGFELIARNETASVSLSGKIDGTLVWGGKSVVSLVKYYRSGASWYRKYSDGFIEQGGNFSNKARGTTVTFPLAFTSTNYQALACINHADNGWTATTTACVRARTTSNMVVQIYHNSSNTTGLNSWYACGY